MHWFFDHCETITDRNIERVKALGGGIAVQNRMAFQGEYFVERYGAPQARRTPPIRRMLEMGVPVGAGTDATRVSSYNPYLSLYWLVTGKTVGGLRLYPKANRLERDGELLETLMEQLVFDGKRKKARSLLASSLTWPCSPPTILHPGGEINTRVGPHGRGWKIVYATDEFSRLAPPELPVSPSWSPVGAYGGYAKTSNEPVDASHSSACSHVEKSAHGGTRSHLQVLGDSGFWGLGCDCFAF